MPGAGKEEFLSAADSMGISFARMGDVVREAYAASEDRKKNIGTGKFAELERERYGIGIWAKRTIERMSGKIFLVDGCRSMNEVTLFKELSDNVEIIAIHSPPEIRYERLVKRGREDAPRDIDEFRARDAREISWGIAEVIALADIMAVNTSTLQEFHAASERIIKGLIE